MLRYPGNQGNGLLQLDSQKYAPDRQIPNYGRYQAEFGFNGATLTNVAVDNNSASLTPSYLINTVTQNTSDANATIYGNEAFGMRLDATFTSTMDYIRDVYVYVASKIGSPTNMIVSIYDETSSSVLGSKTIVGASINTLQMNRFAFDPVIPIIRGHIIQVRINVTGDGSNYMTISQSNSNVLANAFKITTTNNWTSKTDNTTQDLRFEIVYLTATQYTSGTVTKAYTPSSLYKWGNAKWTQTTPTNTSVTASVSGKADAGTAQTITSIAYANKSFSVNSQDTDPNGICFSPDGTKMYIVGNTNHYVYQYTLSTAYDVSTASYASKSFNVTEDTDPTGLTFNSDGTKLYIVGNTNKRAYQYTLSTAYDISTATYASKNIALSADTSPMGIAISPSGTTMFMLGYGSDSVYQYTLSVAWDISTASYAGNNFSVNSQESAPWAMAINPSGTSLFIVGTTNKTVYQYTLSSGWNITTASYTSKSFSVNSQDTTPQGIAFSVDGTTLFMVGTTNNTVYQYTLAEGYNLSVNLANIIKLKSGSSATDNYYNGYVIKITGGTGVGQSRTISGYVGSTKLATVSVNWTTNPDSTSTYSLYLLLNSNISSIADLSNISVTTYSEIEMQWTLSRNSISDQTPTLSDISVSYESPSNALIKIADITLSANASQIDFSGLSRYKSLMIEFEISASSTTQRDLNIRFNDDSGNNYNKQHISGVSTTVAGVQSTSQTLISLTGALPITTNGDLAIGSIMVNNIVSSKRKSVNYSYITFASSSPNEYVGGGQWQNISTLIDKISLIASGDSIGSGSRIVIYSVK